MSTTTPDGGAENAQPTPEATQETTEAVTTGPNADQVITTDDNGTPTLEPVTSQSNEEAVSEPKADDKPQAEETQAAADKTDTEVLEWAEKKGLKISPDNPNELKLARLNLENDRRFHEGQKSSVQPPDLLPDSEDSTYAPLVERQNQLELKQYVRDWFDANPDMKEHRQEFARISQERPWLQNMDDVRAHFLANPSRDAQLKSDGGRQALENLAQKQQQIPPGANATNSGVYESSQISPSNVYDLIDKNDQEWFEKNYDAINKAISGK